MRLTRSEAAKLESKGTGRWCNHGRALQLIDNGRVLSSVNDLRDISARVSARTMEAAAEGSSKHQIATSIWKPRKDSNHGKAA